MEFEYVKQVNSGDFEIYIIDDFELGRPRKTGTYVLPGDDGITLIDTCTSPSLRYIIAGLNELNIELTHVKNIILTHIHVDHAGAAGLLMKCCPNAKLFVHPMGKKFIREPHRLENSLKKIYGTNIFNDQFYPLIPIPGTRIHAVEDKEKLKISEKRELQFVYTPGHADHHMSIHDPATEGVFSGDAIGAYFTLPEINFNLCLPITSPPHFDWVKMENSKRRIQELKPSRIYFGHYGASEKVNINNIYCQFDYWLQRFTTIGKDVWREEQDVKKANGIVGKKIFDEIKEMLKEKGLPLEHPFLANLKPDIDFCAIGIVRYLKNIDENFNV
ncbi:MBL fold metallo-hydrolase [Bacillus cereus]|nr:MBL fold metallo-hydrolase [Bacillus cereus]